MNPIIKYSLIALAAGALFFGGCSREEAETSGVPSESAVLAPITLKVVTFNVWDHYVFPDHKNRMIEIGKLLARLDPDLVGLQEAFIEKDRRLLLDQLEGSRLKYWIYFPSGLMGSGLMIISAFPIREAYFHQYSRSGKWYKPWQGDWHAGKGVARAWIELPENSGYLDFYDTHAIAGYRKQNDLYIEDRLVQMKELADFISRSSPDSILAILTGDMNCRPGSIEYQTVVEQANLVRLMNIGSRIDHIFGVANPNYRFWVSDTEEVSHYQSDAGEKLRLSDHNGYVSTIRIEPER